MFGFKKKSKCECTRKDHVRFRRGASYAAQLPVYEAKFAEQLSEQFGGLPVEVRLDGRSLVWNDGYFTSTVRIYGSAWIDGVKLSLVASCWHSITDPPTSDEPVVKLTVRRRLRTVSCPHDLGNSRVSALTPACG